MDQHSSWAGRQVKHSAQNGTAGQYRAYHNLALQHVALKLRRSANQNMSVDKATHIKTALHLLSTLKAKETMTRGASQSEVGP